MGGERIKVALVPLVLAHHRLATVLRGRTHLRDQFGHLRLKVSQALLVRWLRRRSMKQRATPNHVHFCRGKTNGKWWCPCLCLHLCCCILSASESFLPPASLCCSSHSTVMSSSLPFLSVICCLATHSYLFPSLLPSPPLLSSPLSLLTLSLFYCTICLNNGADQMSLAASQCVQSNR